jgi:hypothetical protein
MGYYQSKLQEEGWVAVPGVKRRGQVSIVGVWHNRWLKKVVATNVCPASYHSTLK